MILSPFDVAEDSTKTLGDGLWSDDWLWDIGCYLVMDVCNTLPSYCPYIRNMGDNKHIFTLED